MKRSDFLKTFAGLAAAIGIAPKIKAETWPKGSVVQDEIGLVQQYPYHPKDCLLMPDRVEMGDHFHTLGFSHGLPEYVTCGCMLLDERNGKYLITAIHRFPKKEAVINIVDFSRSQRHGRSSRRRGLKPRIGRQYIVFQNAYLEL